MSYSFQITDELLESLDDYDRKSKLMERHVIERHPFQGDLEKAVDDDLVYHVPIYDMGQRKYAAFCSLTEALWRREQDVKGNGVHFTHHKIKDDIDWFMLLYLFRLCGSGINYKPKTNHFYGTHGFGNFWIVDSILNGKYNTTEWLQDLTGLDKPFTDNKGYLLPQFSFPGMKGGHLKKFIMEYSRPLVEYIYNELQKGKLDIYQVTDMGNNWLKGKGFKKQNFVLTAFAADLAEYFPEMVNRFGKVYAGTNATKCINALFPKIKKVQEFDYINDVLHFLAERYQLTPIDCEDARACDVVRYFEEYQSPDHIKMNNGMVMKNNSILKKRYGQKKYDEFVQKIRNR